MSIIDRNVTCKMKMSQATDSVYLFVNLSNVCTVDFIIWQWDLVKCLRFNYRLINSTGHGVIFGFD